MVEFPIKVESIYNTIQKYTHIKIYHSTTESGTYDELTNVTTRLALNINKQVYWFTDLDTSETNWFKYSLYNASTLSESSLVGPFYSNQSYAKIGYSFNNYTAPPGQWGEIMTADDMRYTYMWGIDATSTNINMDEFSDEQLKYYVDSTMGEFERYLTIDIRKRIYKTNPANTLIRSVIWREGIDYTDEEDSYDFDPFLWQNYGYTALRHYPVISIERAILKASVDATILNLQDKHWLRLTKDTGELRLYPRSGNAYGPFNVNILPWRLMGTSYPDAFEYDYTTGYLSSDFVPFDLRDIIAKWACVKLLAVIGDGLIPGFASNSVSLDGLAESLSTTQSATSAFFGARIIEYQKEVKDWLVRNRLKFGRIPMGFVGY